MSSIFEAKGLHDWAADRGLSTPPEWESIADRAHGIGNRPSDSVDPSEKPVMVIVDDDPDDLFLLRRALIKAKVNYPLLEARSGQQALELLSQVDTSASALCFILDVKLPDMTGFELLESIRETCLGQPQRYVLLTGNRQPALEQRAAAVGADGFFSKPCQEEEWIEIARALGELAATQ